MNTLKKYFAISLGLVLVAIVAFFYIVEAPKLTSIAKKTTKKPAQRATAINYEGSMSESTSRWKEF